MSDVSQLTSFFAVMFQRMTQRVINLNKPGTGHIGSTPLDVSAPGTGVSGNLGGGAIPIGNIAVYPDPNTIAFIQKGFGGNATVYTIVSAIARKFASLPRYVYEIQDKEAATSLKHYLKSMDPKLIGHHRRIKELHQKAYRPLGDPLKILIAAGGKTETKAYQEAIVSNKLSQLMERPNPMMGQDFFFEVLCSYYETAGECMVWCNRGTGVEDGEELPRIDGPVLEMWPLPPEYLEMVPDPLNVWGLLGWVLNVAGKRIPIDPENVIHIRKPSLFFDGVTRSHMRGMSPLRPGNKKLTEDESATDASVALNQNEGAKGIVYDQTNTAMNPQRETAIRGAIDRKVNNKDMRGAVAYIQGQLGYLDLGQTSVEMELETRKDNIFDRLCNIFQIPPDLFKTGQTYQNMLQARKDFITNKILPTASTFRDEFARVLLPAFGLSPASYAMDVDATQIVELQDDMTNMVQALMNAWWLTPNERRREMNQEPSQEAEADNLWIPNTLVQMQDAAMPDQQPDSFNDDGSPKNEDGLEDKLPELAQTDQDDFDDPTPGGARKNGTRKPNSKNS